MAMIKVEPIENDQKENLIWNCFYQKDQYERPNEDQPAQTSSIEALRQENQQLNEENQRLKNDLILLNTEYHKALNELNEARDYLTKMLNQLE